MLTSRFEEALAYASRLHRDLRRKGTSIPYVSHLLAVASLALEMGADEDQAIAALLHDAVEDQGASLPDIAARFGNNVAAIVADCTDGNPHAPDERSPSTWRQRKEDYVAALAHKPEASLMVSLADKTHNARCIVDDLAVHGYALWSRFSGGPDGVRWYYTSLADRFAQHFPGAAAERFRDIVNRIA